MKWCHLHCHSDYSFLDGVGRSLEYAEIAARHGQPALALTDHGNLYGLPAHWRACEQFGIKPLAGIEWYVNDEREKAKEIKAKKEQVRSGLLDPTFLDAHLVTLALDQTGWKNLLWLNHDSVRNGFYYRPRTTHELICQHAEGLVATTACIGSLFGQYALRGDTEKLRALLGQFRDAFGDRFFYEVHVNEMPEQKKVNAVLRRVAGDMGVRPLLTCDVHYACAGDDARQDEMIATARHQKVDDPKAFKLSTRSLWFMDLKEVWSAAKRFGHDDIDRGFMAEAAANTEEVQDRASVNIFGDGTLRPPPYPIPARAAAVLGRDGRTVDAYAFLRQTCIAGLRERFPDDDGVYRARLNHELSVIRKLNMADFYLVTMDIVRECRRRGVMVWTRGSGCASLAALCCGITAVDPIRFKLLFERFVDPHRPNAPDFDLDIDSSRRYEIIGWLVEKYGGPGGERIARICSIQTFGIKSALRDVLGSRGVEPRVAMRLAEATAAMPTGQTSAPQAEIDLAECPVAQRQQAVEDAIKTLVEAEPAVEQMVRDHEEHIRAALLMVGRARGRSLHAAGYVVAPGPLREFLPVDRAIDPGTKEPTVVTAWTEGQAAQDISPTGLMKIDMLGLETVAVVSLCAAKVADRTGRTREEVDREIDGLRMDYTDPKTLAEFAGGNGIGLHQLNEMNQALATFVRRVRPRGVDDIIACVAAFRPGSMEHLESYVARARGREAVPKVHPIWDRLTVDTYGILIYQEQIMNLLHELGGLELRAAYKAMKAISKKLPEDLAKIKQGFIDHATAVAGVAPALADRMFRDVQSFAGYGFNRAHATSYGVLSWITAHLRAYYPTEFWWAWLCRTENKAPGKGKTERKSEAMMSRARASGIRLLPPLVGRSGSQWRILSSGGLLAPLSLVSTVGEGAADAVRAAWLKERWTDIWGFLAWAECHGRVINARAISALARAGSLSEWVPLHNAVDIAAVFAECKARKAETRTEMTRRLCTQEAGALMTTRPDFETFAAFERAALGFAFWRDAWNANRRREKVESLLAAGRIVGDGDDGVHGKRRAFKVASVRLHTDKRKKQMAFLGLVSPGGRSVKGVVFASLWREHSASVKPDGVYLVRGEFDRDSYLVNGSDPFIPVDDVRLDARGTA